MSTLINGNTLYDTVSITKQNGTVISLDTDGKYIEKDITLTLNVVGGSATTPDTVITANPTISVDSSGLITATNNKTQNITPTVSAGYVSSGTAGTITVSGSNTSQLTTQAAQTITPTTTDQTITSGKYLTGAQTIKGDANLVASNIARGVSIFGVTGTLSSVTLGLGETFDIAVPNENNTSYIAFRFTVDSLGNTEIITTDNSPAIPSASISDNGKILIVENGAWTKVNANNAAGGAY